MKVFEIISPGELNHIERVAETLWKKLGIDIQFTTHFLDRVNDPRNKPSITVDELIKLFLKEYHEYGKTISDLGNTQAVLQDTLSSVNIPFLMAKRGKQQKLITKSVIRKSNFKTSNPVFKV